MQSAPLNPSADISPPRCRGLWLLCAAGFSVLYLATCQHGPSWQDSGMHQWRVLTCDWWGGRGLALAHPLYIAAGQVLAAIPLADLPTRLNAFSGLGLAVALANLACLAATITRRRWIGAGAAAMLAVAHTPWWLGTIAETYAWQAAGLTAELWLLVSLIRRPSARALLLLAGVNGLGLCLHNLSLLPLPIYAVTAVVLAARGRLPKWSPPAAAGAWLAGAAAYLAMAGVLAGRIGLVDAVASAAVGGYGTDVLNVSHAPANWRANAMMAAMNFVSLLGPLAIVGWIRFRRYLGAAAWPVAAMTVLHVAFVARYSIPDQFTFLLPSLALTALAAAVGLAALADASRAWCRVAVAACAISIAAPPGFCAAAPSLAERLGYARATRFPCRDELRYWLVPWKCSEHSAEQFARAALAEAVPDGVIWPDNTSRYPLLLVQRLDGLSGGVEIEDHARPLPQHAGPAAIRKALGDRTLYLVATHPPRLPSGLNASNVDLTRPTPAAVLYTVRWKQ